MKRHASFDELQDFQEGLLPPEESEVVRVHLERCSTCRQELEALSALLSEMGDLPREAEPSRDLWPQIEWRIGRETGGDRGAEQPGPSERKRLRQITLPAWQLLAASITLTLLSGGSVWIALSGGPRDSAPVATAPVEAGLAQPAGWETALDEYHGAVSDLEEVLVAGREVLDPETVRILEENLQAIDNAIDEAQAALTQDPGSKVLGRFLAENLRRKIDLLRRAAIAVYANT
jgi:anti-sigma factor RsiW